MKQVKTILQSLNNDKLINILAFIIYYLILSWLIIFKCNALTSDMRFGFRSITLIPYNNNKNYIDYILNIPVYIPFGIYISLLFKNKSLLLKIMLIIVSSVFYEALQYIIYFGSSDISDIISNTLGGIIGIYLFFKFNSKIKDKSICFINKIVVIIGIPLVIYAIISTIIAFPIYLS